MPKKSEPTFRERRLGDALRLLRERARLTQQEAARALRYDHRRLSRIENGQRPEWEPYLDLHDRATEKGWWHPCGLEDQGFISLENDACTVREFQLGYVPGLLQTEGYIRLYLEHIAGSVHIEDPEQVKVTRLAFEHLSKLALNPEQTAAWLERVQGQGCPLWTTPAFGGARAAVAAVVATATASRSP
jgi:transcriptional regulator with XRE-family HTH domain